MAALFVPETHAMTFDALLARLASKDEVHGLLLFGSSTSDGFSPASDYDLILVLREGSPTIDTIATWVDGHLTEINCKTIEQLEALGRLSGVRDITGTGALVNFLRASRIVFDRSGRLADLQRRLLEMPAPMLPGEHEAYDWWFRIGYNLAHAKRYLSSDDQLYKLTAEVRLLYSVHEVFMAYFAIRGIAWRGDKESVRYLEAHDIDFLNALLTCMREVGVSAKVELYEALARQALGPLGEPWPTGTTMVELGDRFSEGDATERPSVADAQAFWQQLVRD